MDMDLRIQRWFVWVIDSCEALNLTPPRFLIKALYIPYLANVLGRIHENFNEIAVGKHRPHLISGRTVRTHCRSDHTAIMSGNFGCDETDSQNICVTILPGEAQAFRQVGSNDVAIQQSNSLTFFVKSNQQDLGNC